MWIRRQTADHAIRFEVQDTGVGVAADKLPWLWEGFTQMADPLPRGVEGLGLGLPPVKYVVTAVGVDVFAHIEEGLAVRLRFRFRIVKILCKTT